ncbi:MAG: HxlR family transcriptional regulator [Confluentimicrobium sp.]|nr:HxlR family transcriptional regulator [Actibacterium sp.]|tara:strand:- start:81 stop:458 length:378 start_codon:yes stop_codon:yes gene_type:complete
MNTENEIAWNVYKASCPTRQVLNCISDKWAVLIVGCLFERSRRTGELRRNIEGISQKMLTQTLRALERDGLIQRKVFASVPPRVEYALTDLGESLAAIVDQLRRWAEAHVGDIQNAQAMFDLKSV